MRDDARRWRLLALLGGLLALSVLFVHVPAALWAGNLTEFHSSSGALLALGLLSTGVGLVAVSLALGVLPQSLQRAMACVLPAIGVTWWVYGLLLVGKMHALNGAVPPVDVSRMPGTWELGVVALFLGAVAIAAARYRDTAIRLLVFLNIGLLAATTVAVVSAHGPVRATRGVDTTSVFRFSTRTNVLVVVLDELQSDLASTVFGGDPRLASAFDGFVFYKDTLGVAPTTMLSLPAIHSGVTYESGAIQTYFTTAVTGRSFLTLFTKAGYEASLVNPLMGVCPPRLAACVGVAEVLPAASAQRRATSSLRMESIRLLDLSIFRVAPFVLKSWVYNGGRGRVAVLAGTNLPQLAQLALDSNSALEEIASRLTSGDGPPTIKFVHSLATRMPYVIRDDCRTVGAADIRKAESHARCGLQAVAALLDRLKAEGLYDRTVVLLLADHGLNPMLFPVASAGSHDEWYRMAESANPLFMLKPLNSRGPMRSAVESVQLVDVGATLCAATSACTAPHGYPAGQAPANRMRRFNQYSWDDRFWDSMTIPGLTRYDVRGPLDQQASWQRVE